MKKTIFITILLASMLILAYKTQADTSLPLILDILSSKNLDGIAGDFVTVKAQITNIGKQPITDITTYLSLVDNENKLPVDLEDWSAEKGLFIGTIEPNQVFPLNWKIHFVKAGIYSLVVVANSPISETPQVSRITHFKVSPKHNLNPGKILPVALGEPIVLLLIMGMINYKRQRKETL